MSLKCAVRSPFFLPRNSRPLRFNEQFATAATEAAAGEVGGGRRARNFKTGEKKIQATHHFGVVYNMLYTDTHTPEEFLMWEVAKF